MSQTTPGFTNGKDPEGLQKAVTFADFVRMLENGELHQDLSRELRNINAAMENHAMENAGKAKAKLTLTIDFSLDKGIYEMTADPKVTLPKSKRRRSIAWGTPEGYFSPQDPQQLTMFGGPRQVHDAYSAGAAS
jgi:hypothetical protein